MIHLMITLTGCPKELLDDEEYVKEALIGASNASKATLLETSTYKFDPQGVTGYALLAESHVSIHTWPEWNCALCDIFTCSDENTPREGIEYLIKKFEATGDMRNEVARPWPVEAFDGIERGTPEQALGIKF